MFDYLIVGAGLAGSVLAERLATQSTVADFLDFLFPGLKIFAGDGGIAYHQSVQLNFQGQTDHVVHLGLSKIRRNFQ